MQQDMILFLTSISCQTSTFSQQLQDHAISKVLTTTQNLSFIHHVYELMICLQIENLS